MRLHHCIAIASLLLVPSCLVEDEPGDDLGIESAEKAAAKVKICHIPPGNPLGAQTQSVASSAVPAHLAHGDSLGPCVCPPTEEWTCYSAPLETDGIGTCQRGVKTCQADGQGYGECVGEITPVAEVCGDGLDNDCDGETDEDCTGCVPVPETCGDGIDDDCDGEPDNGCVCVPGAAAACYDGPAGTDGVGVCSAGTTTCNADGFGYGACLGSIEPTAEVCGDGLDNDCDGQADEGCTTCVPAPEVCGDHVDNDCDGRTDEGCLGDRVWYDRDLDGVQDPGESGLAGAVAFLRSASTGALLAVSVSGATGTYWFTGVPNGTYFIEVIPPAGWAITFMDVGGDDVDSDFDEFGSSSAFSYGGDADDTRDCGLINPGGT
jgi:hypothetical protein